MIKDRISALRKLMKQQGVDAYIIPSTDPHQSEYVPELWQRRKFISGFSGSAGDVVITQNSAGLWTDSRYYIQAEKELQHSGIDLYKIGIPGVPTIPEWLKSQLAAGSKVGLDPRLFSFKEINKYEAFFKGRKIELKFIDKNLVDDIWDDQPAFPAGEVKAHPIKYSGKSIAGKLQLLREKMAEQNAAVHILTTLDSIAWLYNIRCNDVQYNPVQISYAVVTPETAKLFIKKQKISGRVRDHLNNLVEIYDYEAFESQLKKIAKNKSRVWLDPESANAWIFARLEDNCEIFLKESPVTKFKAIKNETEISGLKAAHLRDGVAMVKFLHWLEKAAPDGGITEISAANKADEFRSEQDLYQGSSFETIAGYGEHGAIVHYAATSETDVELKSEGIFLFDSGAQYLDGTTDITRTVALGKPTDEQKEHFTRVLKGHIQLALTRFPRATAGNQLDTIARKPLWDIGRNYGHGTGHGIGSYLSVHEGPHAISFYRAIGVLLEPGMIISNEPGYYKTGEYGMRIENVILTVKDEEFSSEDSEFYKFETITLCPIDLTCVEKSLLNNEEIAFLNNYHHGVREALSGYLEGEELEWLNHATRWI